MERLTDKSWRNLDPWECCGQDKYCKRGCHDEGGCNNGCIVPKLYSRLARYEDAEEQGRLIVLPCKVGDMVYEITPDVAEIVRCKDCKYTKKGGCEPPAIYCEKWDRWEMPEDAYCYLGRKK